MRCDSGLRVGNVFESKRRNRKWTENQGRGRGTARGEGTTISHPTAWLCDAYANLCQLTNGAAFAQCRQRNVTGEGREERAERTRGTREVAHKDVTERTECAWQKGALGRVYINVICVFCFSPRILFGFFDTFFFFMIFFGFYFFFLFFVGFIRCCFCFFFGSSA